MSPSSRARKTTARHRRPSIQFTVGANVVPAARRSSHDDAVEDPDLARGRSRSRSSALLLVLTAATWFVLISPKRNQSSNLSSQIQVAQATPPGTQTTARTRRQLAVSQSLFIRRALPTPSRCPQVILELSRVASEEHVSLDSDHPAARDPVLGLRRGPDLDRRQRPLLRHRGASCSELRNQVKVDSRARSPRPAGSSTSSRSTLPSPTGTAGLGDARHRRLQLLGRAAGGDARRAEPPPDGRPGRGRQAARAERIARRQPRRKDRNRKIVLGSLGGASSWSSSPSSFPSTLSKLSGSSSGTPRRLPAAPPPRLAAGATRPAQPDAVARAAREARGQGPVRRPGRRCRHHAPASDRSPAGATRRGAGRAGEELRRQGSVRPAGRDRDRDRASRPRPRPASASTATPVPLSRRTGQSGYVVVLNSVPAAHGQKLAACARRRRRERRASLDVKSSLLRRRQAARSTSTRAPTRPRRPPSRS